MRAKGLQLKHIEAFRAVIATGSASKAAFALGVSQPAVSKMIAQAELLSGISLFERRQGRLLPTDLAIRLYSETDVLFSTLDNIDDIVSRVVRNALQPISLGAVPVAATTLLPKVLPDWQRDADRIMNVGTYDVPTLSSLLSAQRIELAITLQPSNIHNLRRTLILKSPVYCALPAHHSLAGKRVIRAADLHGENYIGLSREEGNQTLIDLVFQGERVNVREVMNVPLMASAVRMAEGGAGIALVDVFGIHTALPSNLVYRRFEPALSFEYFAVWHEHRETDFDRKGLIKLLRRKARTMLEDAEAVLDD